MPLKSLRGVVQTRSYSDLDSNRYDFLSLDQAEPNLGIPESDGSLVTSDKDGSRSFTTFPRLSGLKFKAGSLDEVTASLPQYFLVLKNDPTDGVDDSVGWTLGAFEEQDTLQTVTDRGNTTSQDITIAALTADSALFRGDIVVDGNLTVNGTQTIINSTTLTVDDKNIVIAQGATTPTEANGGGITLEGANATITYNSTTDTWQFNKGIDAVARSTFDSAVIEVLDLEDLYIGGKVVFDSTGPQEIIKTTDSLTVRSDVFELKRADGVGSFAVFQEGDIQFSEIATFIDSTTIAAKTFLTDVPTQAGTVKVLFRRTADGLVMEGEIDTANVDKIKTQDTDSDSTFYLLFTEANGGTGGFDSAYIDTSTLTYNPFSNTLTLENVVATGVADLDSAVVAGDIQIKTSASVSGSGRLLDSDGRSFVIYDSSGFLLWGNNGTSAGNGPVVTGSTLNDLFDVSITTLDDGQFIQYNQSTGQWENVTVAPGSGATTLLELTDVAGDGSSGQVLTTDGAGNFSFQTVSGGGGASAINDLTDVTITSPSPNQVLKYNGSTWVNATDATGSGVGTLSSRTTPSVTTSSLANNAQIDANITNGFPTYALLKIATSHAAWVRIYTDTTARTNDASRLITDDPAPDAGVVAEIITTGAETIRVSPGVIGWNENADTTIPIRVQNLSGGTASITVTLTAVELEA